MLARVVRKNQKSSGESRRRLLQRLARLWNLLLRLVAQHLPGAVGPRALVVLRVERGAAPPASADVRAAIAADRARLALPPAPLLEYRLAGPYPLELDGASIDEYVAWEV